jgi:hypothetical protein
MAVFEARSAKDHSLALRELGRGSQYGAAAVM